MILQMYQRAKAGEQLRLFKYGEQMRDFVYIRDVIAANLAALEAPRSGVCNVGSGKARSFNDIVENLGKQLGESFDVEYIDNPFTFYQMHTEADLSESKAIMGWEPSWSLEKGIEDYVQLLESGHRGPAETA
jgi:ADP-L-glycero-D-manno-heptose 6-epimerase